MRDLPENIDSKYRFIMIASMRCDMLQKGAKPKVDEERYAKYTSVAMEEVLEGLIAFEIIKATTAESEEDQGSE